MYPLIAVIKVVLYNEYTGFSGSYDASDVIFLLKDISSLINEEDNLTREIAMSSGNSLFRNVAY